MNPETSAQSSRLEPGGAPPEADPVQLIADTIGQMMEFWGFKHIMGRLWTILYLSPHPLSAPILAQRLGVSAGGVSMALRDLQEWGAIRKLCPKDSRKDHFVAEANIWKLVTRVLSQREGQRIETALDSMEEALNALKNAKQKDPHTAFQIQQLEELKKLSKLARKLLKLLVRQAKVDVTPLIDFKGIPADEDTH